MAKEDIIEHQFDKLTAERQQEIARMGGIASAKARKEKATMQEQARLLLSLAVKNPKLKKTMNELGIEETHQTNQMAMIIAMMNKAISKGDVQAYNSLQATIGEQPVAKVEQNIDANISTKQKNAIDDVIGQMKPIKEDDM